MQIDHRGHLNSPVTYGRYLVVFLRFWADPDIVDSLIIRDSDRDAFRAAIVQ